jgi:hypothetical protein
MTCIGQRRSGKSMVENGRYLWIGMPGIGISWRKDCHPRVAV